MKVAFDWSLMHLDTNFSYLSFPQITEHPPKKRVNVDTKDQGDKLFENIKSLRRRKTECMYRRAGVHFSLDVLPS